MRVKSAGRFRESRQHADHGGLARAVRPEKAADRSSAPSSGIPEASPVAATQRNARELAKFPVPPDRKYQNKYTKGGEISRYPSIIKSPRVMRRSWSHRFRATVSIGRETHLANTRSASPSPTSDREW